MLVHVMSAYIQAFISMTTIQDVGQIFITLCITVERTALATTIKEPDGKAKLSW